VRDLAEKYQLPTRARKDSQGICFLGKLKFDEFIEHYLGENEGPIRCYQTGDDDNVLNPLYRFSSPFFRQNYDLID
jgi:tRNA U34 2-thiouridine synthase MnmA/TrmU